MNVTGRRRSRAVAVLLAGIFAAGAAGAADLGRLLPGSRAGVAAAALRAPRRAAGAEHARRRRRRQDVRRLQLQWPFPRTPPRAGDRPPAPRRRAGDRLRRAVHRADDGARRQRAHRRHRPRAQRRAGHRGDRRARRHQRARRRRVRCKSIGAQAAASNLPEGRGGVLQRVEYEHGGLPTLATVAARLRRATRPAGRRSPKDGAWIDFHGPPGTIDTVSFSDLVKGRVDPARVRGRIVVVGAASPTLQDVHPTPTSDRLMSGPEIEANAIDTVIRGNPLHRTPTLGRPADRAGARRSCPALVSLRTARARGGRR